MCVHVCKKSQYLPWGSGPGQWTTSDCNTVEGKELTNEATIFRVGRGRVPAHLAEIAVLLMGFRVWSVADTKMQEQKNSLTNEA